MMLDNKKVKQELFSARRKPTYWWQKLVWLIAVVAFVYFLGDYFLGGLSDSAVFVSKPILKLEDSLVQKGDTWQGLFRSKLTLESRNDQLTTELQSIKLRLLGYESLLEENKRLKAILGRGEGLALPIIATVLGTPADFPYGVILLDIGTENASRSISVGDEVRVEGNVFIGELIEISDRYSKARVLWANGETTPVIIGIDNVAAEAKGLGGGNYSVSLPRGVPVEVGDLIKVSASGEELTLGVVAEISGVPSDPFQEVYFKTPVNMSELRHVEIYAR